MDVRRRFLTILSKYWWILALVIIAGLIFTKSPIFKYIIFAVATPFLIMLFLPFLLQLFTPAFFLISELLKHFQQACNMPLTKKYIFVPMSLVAAVLFITVQTVLSIWVFILSFFSWADIIGPFFAILLIFFFGLAPLAILTAPFVVWYKAGFPSFLNTLIFFLTVLFWYGLSKLAFSEDYYSSTPENFLGYSPQTFLLGTLSTQIIALPFYFFKVPNIGSIISDIVGFIFLTLTLISAIKWWLIKRKLSNEEKLYLYRPSVWVYILGFITTDFIYRIYLGYREDTFILMWLNVFFAFALINRFLGFIHRKIVKRKET